jgi:hypothetical protein
MTQDDDPTTIQPIHILMPNAAVGMGMFERGRVRHRRNVGTRPVRTGGGDGVYEESQTHHSTGARALVTTQNSTLRTKRLYEQDKSKSLVV